MPRRGFERIRSGGAGALGDEELRLLFQLAAGEARGGPPSRMNPRLRRPVSTAGVRSLMENAIFDGDKGVGWKS
jgi:hypothetical protein